MKTGLSLMRDPLSAAGSRPVHRTPRHSVDDLELVLRRGGIGVARRVDRANPELELALVFQVPVLARRVAVAEVLYRSVESPARELALKSRVGLRRGEPELDLVLIELVRSAHGDRGLGWVGVGWAWLLSLGVGRALVLGLVGEPVAVRVGLDVGVYE